MTLKIITPVAVEPISLAEARRHLNLPGAFDSPQLTHHKDSEIEVWISSAREQAESYTGRALAVQTLELALDEFPADELRIPRPPLVSITSVKYIDGDGVEQTVSPSAYTLDDYSQPSWILPAIDTSWSTTRAVVNAVKVRYVAGYSNPSDSPQTHPLPKSIRSAMLLAIGYLYENAEDAKIEELPLASRMLLNPWRLEMGFA